MAAPVGAVVTITYDSGEPPRTGDYLRAARRVYRVLWVSTVAKGPNTGTRHRLRCLVEAEIPEGARVLPLVWYPRERSRRG